MYIFVCEDSIDGIFSGVYDAWASHYGHSNVALTIREAENLSLFDQYISVPTDFEKSKKVARTLRLRLGMDVYSEICQAASAIESDKRRKDGIDKADAIYKTIVLALSIQDGSKVLTFLGNPYVNQVFQLSRAAGNEAHHLMGFLRFHELESGILFAKIHPKHGILSFLTEHFCDRLPEENFLIYDEDRKKAGLHKAGAGWLITDTQGMDESFLERFSEEEYEYQRLWCGFFESIAIEARKNKALQNQNIPKRFQKDALEFQ